MLASRSHLMNSTPQISTCSHFLSRTSVRECPSGGNATLKSFAQALSIVDMTSKQFAVIVHFCTCLGLLQVMQPLLAQESPAVERATLGGVATNSQPGVQAPAPGARRGGFGRGAPLTADDEAAIAKLAQLPAWKPGVA